jgi:hypothetical protein
MACKRAGYDGFCVASLNVKFSHKFYDYSDLPEDTFGQRLKKLRLSMGLSQFELANKIDMPRYSLFESRHLFLDDASPKIRDASSYAS